MTFNVKITKLSANDNKFRTKDMVGQCTVLPKVDECFIMFGEGLEFGTRLFKTSVVESVEQVGSTIKFVTMNSTYQLDILNN